MSGRMLVATCRKSNAAPRYGERTMSAPGCRQSDRLLNAAPAAPSAADCSGVRRGVNDDGSIGFVRQFPFLGRTPEPRAQQFTFEDELLGQAVKEHVELLFVGMRLGRACFAADRHLRS